MDLGLKDKVVIITGGASGVGRGDALLLAREGAKVVITHVNDQTRRAGGAGIGDHAIFLQHDLAPGDGRSAVLRARGKRFRPPGVPWNKGRNPHDGAGEATPSVAPGSGIRGSRRKAAGPYAPSWRAAAGSAPPRRPSAARTITGSPASRSTGRRS